MKSSWTFTQKNLKFLELSCRVNQVDMPQKHCPAAVSLQSQFIHYFFPVFAFISTFFVFFVQMRDRFSATEASYWNNRFNHL